VRPLQEEERGCITIVNKTLKTEYMLDAVKRLWKIKCFQFLIKRFGEGFVANVGSDGQKLTKKLPTKSLTNFFSWTKNLV